MPHLTVYTAPGCCLCDEAAPVLESLARELQLGIEYVDITGDPQLEQQHRTEIPVGYLDGRKVFKYRVDAALLRRRAAALTAWPPHPPVSSCSSAPLEADLHEGAERIQ